jgi:hypothetical protein
MAFSLLEKCMIFAGESLKNWPIRLSSYELKAIAPAGIQSGERGWTPACALIFIHISTKGLKHAFLR